MGDEYRIPWAKPRFWGDEQRYVAEALGSQWISGGPFVDRFERGFADFHGTSHAIATSSGTTALHLAYLAVDIRPGDEIIVPGFAFMAAANLAVHMHAMPVFADIDPDTWVVTAEQIERRLSAKTRAIVPVHTYGNMCSMREIVALAAIHGIPVIEDVAEALATSFGGRRAGTFGAIGTFSLHATKAITTGEGGMVVTDDSQLNQRMHLYRSHGMSNVRYWHEVAGHNFRLTNMQAALGCAQLAHIGEVIAARKQMFARYRRHLEHVEGIVMQLFPRGVDAVPWVAAIKLDPRAFPQGRERVMQEMRAAGIETRPGFYTPSSMRHLYQCDTLEISDEVSASILVLPSFCELTEEQIELICATLRDLRR